jgi:four helix bundle protein
MNVDDTGEGRKEKGAGTERGGAHRSMQEGAGRRVDLGVSLNRKGPIDSFEDLEIWRRAIDLAATTCAAFDHARNFALRDQVQRAAISISSNIAEGYERASNADFVRFLYYAKGSCGELRSQLHLAGRMGLLAGPTTAEMLAEARLLSRQLGAYIHVRETRFS